MVLLADILLTFVPTASVPHWLTSWVPGKTPFSTWPAVSTAILSYLAVIFGLRELTKDQPVSRLQGLFRAHNASLSVASLILLALMMEEVLLVWQKVGAYDAFCATTSWTTRLEFYYMVNYYFKYIEFLDTIFLVLKKRPLCKGLQFGCSQCSTNVRHIISAFLHVFHHSTTALLTFVQIEGRVSGAWTAISLNLAVHVVMYYYYFAAAGGAKIWWKKHLTTVQIIQFIIDLVVFYFGLYQHFTFKYWPHLPHIGDCAGDERVAMFGTVLIAIFLTLFANFYVQTYKKPNNQGKRTYPPN